MMETDEILSADLLDILFENRNKDYGAYELRRTYHKRIAHALTITTSVALLVFLGSFVASSINMNNGKIKIREVILQNIEQEEVKRIIPPPLPPKPELPKVEMKQFTPPKIVKDEEVQKPPPEQQELKEAKIDVINQEGIKDQMIATPSQIDEGKQVILEKKDDDPLFEKVEIEASFKGDWKRYLSKSLSNFSASENGASAGSYTTIIQFIVDKDGTISDVKALTDWGYGMEEAGMKVIKNGPPWEPAIQNGRKVKAYKRQPITFIVSGE